MGSRPQASPDEKFEIAKLQIEGIVKALIDTWNQHDMAKYAAQFAEDADFVNVLGMHFQGRNAIESQHVLIHRTIFRNSRLRLVDYSIRPLRPGVVLAHIKWEMTGHERPPGASFAEVRQGLITGVFVEQDDRWLIAAFQNTDIVPVPALQGPK